MSLGTGPELSDFARERHVKYWLRCLKTFLPHLYISTDSSRMTLALFTLSALDLLGVLHESTTPSERSHYIDWIYRCQHPSGGFRGFTGANFGDVNRTVDNEHWDPANLAATFFALAGLAILRDSMERVKRRECLEWLAKLQLDGGSFGEGLGKNGQIEGDPDIRYCFLAAVTRWMLKDRTQLDEAKDIDVDKLAAFIIASKTYDGGIGQAPSHEAHAGFTYNGLGALSLLGRLPSPNGTSAASPSIVAADESFVQDVVHWLVYRQTTMLADDTQASEGTEAQPRSAHKPPLGTYHSVPTSPDVPPVALEGPPDHHDAQIQHPGPSQMHPERNTHLLHMLKASTEKSLAHASAPAPLRVDPGELLWVGFSGRCNKFADTCYSWWAGSTLIMLQKAHLLSFDAIRRYLLEKTQHIVGGFGKLPGDPPDILHSYLGLAALAAMKEPGLRSIDPTLCISVSAREHLESMPWRQDSHAALQGGSRDMQKQMANITLRGG
ncbi:Geranylgeranyl transferase type-1 subunit beta [Xylographa opegraphella]|nr:Geranylgeranyl transferase type-1 subunit beta [Xylographa opegraphella]